MRTLFFLIRTLHKTHRIIAFAPHPNPIPKLNPHVPFGPFYQRHFIAAFYQTATRPFHANQENLHHLIKLPDFGEYVNQNNQIDQLGIHDFSQSIQKAKDFASGDEAISFLDDLGAKPSKDSVFSAIWELREEWKLAFLVFKWGQKWGCTTEKSSHLMVWLLGNHQKFSTAWSVIYDLHSASIDTELAMLILIDRYVAANCPGKAIETFQTMEKFRLSPDQRTFLTFLDILCRHGNIEEAEEYLFLNKKLFPLDTQSYNIILNGWCNVIVDVYEAKRVWREMSKNCILPDGASYVHMISCFSKVGNLFDSLRLYDEMQKRGWIPGAEVYNSLIYVLTSENCLNEALKIVDRMKEIGLQPNSSTYNSMILPLCDAMKTGEAKTVLAMMIEDNAGPTIDTYHAFLGNGNFEITLEVLNNMKDASLGPTNDTFLIVLDKLFKLKQPGNALKIWEEMDQYNIIPGQAHYNAMMEGLAKHGLLVEAKRFHMEIISKGMFVDPKLNKLIEEPVDESCHNKGRRKLSSTSTRHIKRSKQKQYANSSSHRSQRAYE
ncbi:hypothetical protein LIER_03815 [Lithospermum erythrorhizon]|uniref:Pentatricopeptide repeat-containing protein n=1 Tax=Lithospermum erythrorhizon TaxID=34254 RepID=A0AAV3NZ63_LITER